MIGFTISALVHLLVVLPLMVAIMTARQAPQVMTARFDPESFREENPRQELQLGIEARTDARMTWIGYEEYQEHLAQLAEFEQAAFSESPGAAPSEPTPTAAPSNPTPNDPVDPATEGQPTDQPTPGDIPAEAQVASNEFTEPGPGDLEPETPGGNAATPQVEPLRDEQAQQVKPPESASSAASTDDLGGRSEPSAEMTTTSTPAGIETIRSLVDEVTAVMIQAQAMTPNETTPSPPSEAAEPSVASPPGAGSGDPSDKDADPSSTVEVPLDELKRGKPLAAHGLELKPRRPDFAPAHAAHRLARQPAGGDPIQGRRSPAGSTHRGEFRRSAGRRLDPLQPLSMASER